MKILGKSIWEGIHKYIVCVDKEQTKSSPRKYITAVLVGEAIYLY